MTVIAIIGLGEAGRAYAEGLRGAGADVRGFDPNRDASDLGIAQAPTLAEALAGAEVVLSLVGAHPAEQVAAEALAATGPTTVFADLNTTGPEVKQRIARLAAERGVPMADVGVLAPVHRAGHRTPLLASGVAASAFDQRMSPLGIPVTVIDGPAGEAARLKLMRSVFMKGLAALIVEGLGAARAAGAEDWLRDQIAREFGPGGEALVERLVEGTHRHAVRREQEVREALAVIEDEGRPADMTRATLAWFERIVAERSAE